MNALLPLFAADTGDHKAAKRTNQNKRKTRELHAKGISLMRETKNKNTGKQ